MKTKLELITICHLLSAICVPAFAQGTAFTYQGRLNSGINPATGIYDLRFKIYDSTSDGSQVGPVLTNSPTAVTNGLFTVMLDFGNQFSGADRWLEIGVRTNGAAGFSTLVPRQKLTPTPYAIFASTASNVSGTISAANLSGTYGNAVTFNNAGNSFTGNGSGLTSVNAATLNGLGSGNFWQTGGNAGTTPGANFLGTTDNQPLEFKVNGLRVLRLENNGDSGDGDATPDGAPNVIGGSPRNFVGAGVEGATIAGGGATNYSGFAYTNSVLADFGFVGGGRDNSIAANAIRATIAGGEGNGIGTNSSGSAIGGGFANNIAANSLDATIAGGASNDIGTNSDYSAIGGGNNNDIAANSLYATIAGGLANDIGTSSDYGAIGGGNNNNIAANSAWATIAGGFANDIGTNSSSSAIGGGEQNNIAGNSGRATIAGGAFNDIGANSDYGAIGGGFHNDIADNSEYATIPGGRENAATNFAFAAGSRAKANHQGAFVWADSTDADFASTAADQFSIRASGGARFSDDTPELAFGATTRQMLNLHSGGYSIGVQGGTLYQRAATRFSWFKGGTHSDVQNDAGAGGTVLMTLLSSGLTVNGTFVSVSDRNAKENFSAVDTLAVLAKVAALPLAQWNYKADEDKTRHLGPMAQDFYAAFNLGTDDKHIATVDADGVALAAIQGLNQKLDEKNTEIQELKQRLEVLEKIVLNQKPN